MRTLEEIRADVVTARDRSAVQWLRSLAKEMQALGTPTADAYAHSAFGIADELTGSYPSAMEHYGYASRLHEELGDRDGMARVIINIGNVHRKTGDHASALEHYRRALAVFEEKGDRIGVAIVNGNIGNVFTNTGRHGSALEHYRRALELHEALGDRAGVARVTNGMANVYYKTDDYPAALERYRNALSLFEEIGDRVGVGHATSGMGNVSYSTHDFPAALEHYRRAMAILEDLDDRASVASVTGNMGNVLFELGDHSAALEHYRRSVALHEELGDRSGVVRETGTVISTLMKLERYDEAAELLERQAHMQFDHPGVRAQHYADRATLAEHRQDLDAAHRYLLEALELSTEAGLRAESAGFHAALRDLAQKRNDFAGYIEHNKEYTRLAEEIRGKETTQRMAMMEAERRMEGERRERDKERALLYGALPKSVADRMIRGEDVSGDHFDHAAVMFLDIVGFTSHTSDMPPSDVVKMLENIFRTIDAICDTHEVVKVKTIGDSYMCFRGDADASSNALSIAHVALEAMKHTFVWPDGTPLLFRIGMHIGPATAGVIGTQRLQYDVWGDTVNVASRMESTGEAGRVHVTEAFASEMKKNTEYTIQNSITESGNQESHDVPLVTRNSSLVTQLVTIERGSFDIKGKGPMQTYWLEYAS